jgi:hypothetical protein
MGARHGTTVALQGMDAGPVTETTGLGESDGEERAVAVLMEEMRSHAGDIRNRVDMQHKNFNVFIVLTTALTGYLVNYWNDHGLQDGSEALFHSEIVLLLLLVPLFACVFAWRHADHDANIIDDAAYVESAICPKLRSYAGDQGLLRWEAFLRRRRVQRMKRVGPVAMLSTEPVIMGLIAVIFLFAGWYLRIDQAAYAGEAEQLFDIVLYVDTVAVALSAYIVAATAFGGYAGLGSRAGLDSNREFHGSGPDSKAGTTEDPKED